MRALIGALSLVVLAGGCASIATSPGTAPAERLDRGLDALREGDYGTATETLLRVRAECRGHPLGRQALLVWAAVELDPRNPDSRLDELARTAALHLARTDESSWTRPLVESIYLLALQRGADEPTVPASPADAGANEVSARTASTAPDHPLIRRDDTARRCGLAEARSARTDSAAGGSPSALPSLPGLPFTTRIAGLENRTEHLESTTAQLRQIIVQLEQELERIRETLRP